MTLVPGGFTIKPGMYFAICLSDQQKDSITQKVQLLRAGLFSYEGRDDLDITPQMLLAMKKNFDEKVRGYEDGKLPIDYWHDSDKLAAGWIESLELKNNDSELWADVKWTAKAKSMINDGELRYLSAEFHFDYEANEGGKKYGPTLFGGGLTNRPFVKGMEPVARFKEKDPIEEKIETKNTGEDKMSKVVKANEGEICPEGGMSPEDMKNKMAALEAELSEYKKKLSDYEAKMGDMTKEKQMSDKAKEFDKLLSEGKAVEAQREAFIGGDTAKFAELAKPTNMIAAGNTGKESEVSTKDAQEEILELAEKHVKELKMPLSKAISKALSENKALAERYAKDVAVR